MKSFNEDEKFSGGFKAMLRDRMLLTTNLALKRCKCKNAYIDYVYDRFVRCVPVERRKNVVKEILGLKVAVTSEQIRVMMWRYNRKLTQNQINRIPVEDRCYSFEQTIDWDQLKKDDFKLFKRFEIAKSWVNWFKARFQDVENTYTIGKKTGKTDVQIKESMHHRYGIDEDTIKFLFKYFKNEQC